MPSSTVPGEVPQEISLCGYPDDRRHPVSGRQGTLAGGILHTFNTLHDGHKQIVLSSDRPASEIEKLEHRLVSRFEWGMTAELQPPDIETRIALLKKKAEGLNIALDPWVIEFLADRIRNNVRRLEGALMRVASYKSLSDREITREVIENLLRDIFQEQARRAVTIEQIQRKVPSISMCASRT